MPKRPIDTMFVSIDRVEVLLNADDTYADDHRYVRARPELFRDIVIIEQATAAPGERRASVRR